MVTFLTIIVILSLICLTTSIQPASTSTDDEINGIDSEDDDDNIDLLLNLEDQPELDSSSASEEEVNEEINTANLYGGAQVLTSFPPESGSFYWVIAVVPSLDKIALKEEDVTNSSSGSQVNRILEGFDNAVKANCIGVVKCGVYVDDGIDEAHVRVFTSLDPTAELSLLLEIEGGEESDKDQAKFGNVKSAIQHLNLNLPDIVTQLPGQQTRKNTRSMARIIESTINTDRRKFVVIAFTRKESDVTPAFLKNVALLVRDVGTVVLISNPSESLLKSFQVSSVPGLTMLYDTPPSMRGSVQGGSDSDNDDGSLVKLGQSVYPGKFRFMDVFSFVVSVLQQISSHSQLEGGAFQLITDRAVNGLGVVSSFESDTHAIDDGDATSTKASKSAEYKSKAEEEVSSEFAKYGNATPLTTLQPPGNFIWIVAVVPSAPLEVPAELEAGDAVNPNEKEEEGVLDGDGVVEGKRVKESAIEKQLPGWDAAVKSCLGSLKAGVYVDGSIKVGYLRVFSLPSNSETENKKEKDNDKKVKEYTNVQDAMAALIESIPLVIKPIVGDNSGMSNFVQQTIALDRTKFALLIFSSKSTVPSWLRNFAYLLNGICDVGLINNPRDDLLSTFGVTDLPALVLLHDHPPHLREGGAGDGEMKLGQSVYSEENFGKLGLKGLIGFVGMAMTQMESVNVNVLQDRLQNGFTGLRLDDRGGGGFANEVEVGEFTNDTMQGIIADTSSSDSNDYQALLFLDGYAKDYVDDLERHQAELVVAQSKVSGKAGIKFKYIHATCNPSFAQNFEVSLDLLPQLVVWNARTRKFAKYRDSKFDGRSLSRFTSNVVKGGVGTTSLREDVVYGDIVILDGEGCNIADVVEDEDIDMDAMLAEMKEDEELRRLEVEAQVKLEREELARDAEMERVRVLEEEKKLKDEKKKKAKKSKKKKKTKSAEL